LPVPACPDWTTGHVAAHVGRAFNWVREIVETRAQNPVSIRPNDHSHDPADPDLPAWFHDSTVRFLDTMSSAGADEPVWSWSGDQRVIFWIRLMAHEAAIHRCDAQSALPEHEPIPTTLACDAIDGVLGWFLPGFRGFSLLPSRGESYLLEATDAALYRLIRFEGNDVKIESGIRDTDVGLRGSASDLLLFLWHRLPADRLEAEGNVALLQRFFDLAPVP
jgi:uncharacterized protein (TIGR03083 family)